jgi:hypothetical protein
MVVLRYRDKRPREWRVPFNIDIGKTHLPIGLFVIAGALILVAITNLFTKPIATISGVSFTIIFFLVFVISEFIVKKRLMKENHLSEKDFEKIKHGQVLEHFNLGSDTEITPEVIGCEHPDRVMVAVRDPNNLIHLQKILSETDTEKTDIIVMIARVFKDKVNVLIKEGIEDEERHLFSEVVNIAKKIGKPVIPIVVPTNNAFFAIVSVAKDLGVQCVVLGISGRIKIDFQIQQLALLWGMVESDESNPLCVRIIEQNKETKLDL